MLATALWFLVLLGAASLTRLSFALGLFATLAVLWVGLFWSSVVNG